jgi:cysteine desulfurase
MSFVYLDWAATAPPDPEILDSVTAAAMDYFANPSAIHRAGRRAESLLEHDRRRLAEILGCRSEEVVFTSGGTESNNLVLSSVLQPSVVGSSGGKAQAATGRGRRKIVVSGLEHASVYNPAVALRRFGFEVTIVPADADGRVDPERITSSVDEQTSLVALMLVNNETGAIQPVAEVGRALDEHRRRSGRRVHLHCDAVQAFGKIPVAPVELGVDSLSLSAHKIGGPRGVGALFLGHTSPAEPLYLGGDQEGGRRPGTENLPGIHGLVLAAERAHRQLEENLVRAGTLMTRLVRGLEALGVAVLVPTSREANNVLFSPYIVNVAFPPVPGEVLVRVLEEEGFLVSTGSACSSRKKNRFRVHENMGVAGEIAFSSIRISLGSTVRPEDLDGLVDALKRRLPQLLKVAAP